MTRKEFQAGLDRATTTADLSRRFFYDLIATERQTRNEQIEQAYGQAMKLFGSLQSKLLALEEHLGVEVKWVEPESKPGHYEAVKVKKARVSDGRV